MSEDPYNLEIRTVRDRLELRMKRNELEYNKLRFAITFWAFHTGKLCGMSYDDDSMRKEWKYSIKKANVIINKLRKTRGNA